MKQSRARALATSGLALSLAAAVYGVLAQPPRDAHGALSEQVADPASRRHEAVLRSWLDRVKIDGRDEARLVEIVFDYELGAARRRVYDAQDWLISDEMLAGQPRASSAEIDEAFDTVRRDPEIGQLIRFSSPMQTGWAAWATPLQTETAISSALASMRKRIANGVLGSVRCFGLVVAVDDSRPRVHVDDRALEFLVTRLGQYVDLQATGRGSTRLAHGLAEQETSVDDGVGVANQPA